MLVLVASLAAAPAPPPVQSPTVLRWKLKQGDTFRVDLQQDTRQLVTTAGKTMEIPQTMLMQMTWSVEAVDPQGIIKMTQTIDRVSMAMQPPGQKEVKYDSASGQPPTGFAKTLIDTLAAMVGVKITQTMNERGKVLDVQVPEDTLSKVAANPTLKQFFSTLKDLMGKASPEFPEQPMNSGHRWEADVQAPSPLGAMRIHTTYTYEGKEQRNDRELDRIGMVMEIAIEGGGQLGANVKILQQDNSGDAYFDAERGYFAESKTVQKMKLELEVLGNAMQQSIETTQQLTVTPTTPAPPPAP
ncbi:MAG: hypothetical protein A2W31_01220 [Planctomycetes bacterium RBG_16_64_10]|nr:MAG: hypothetical protein A2W31_01220 [Planctomycetes bacterium RBG_16_64_10]